MNVEERAAAAAELKATGKCNCTQAVVKVFEDKLPIDGGRHSHRWQRHAPYF